MMKPKNVIMETGFWPGHDPKKAGLSPEQAAANRKWFAEQWQRIAPGGIMQTNYGAYLRTDRGFRRISAAQAKMRRPPGPVPRIEGDEITVPMEIFSERHQSGLRWEGTINIPRFRADAERLKQQYASEFGKFDIDDWWLLNDTFTEIEPFFPDEANHPKITKAAMVFLLAYYNSYEFPVEKVTRIHITIPDKPMAGHRILNVMMGIGDEPYELPALPRLNVWKLP